MTPQQTVPKLLALDTATEACSVAVYSALGENAYFELAPREHTQRILPMVEEILATQSLTVKQLNAIVCCLGPGSFTGVRIGIGIAQGLAYGAKLPLIGVSTLATLAQGAWRLTGVSRVLVAIDARMGEVYWAEYQRDSQGVWQGKESEAVLSPEQAQQRMQALSGSWVTAGTGWEAYPELVQNATLALTSSENLLPHAQDMLPLALQAWQCGETIEAAAVEPVYLRNEVTWKKLPGR